MAASIYQKSGDMVLDNSGNVAPGAKLYFYDAETTTPRDTYSDADLTSERTHPVVADGNGRVPIIYLQYGAYDVKCTTSGGTQLFYHQNIANPEPFDDTTDFDTSTLLTTGDMFSSVVNGTRTGAVRLNGRTIGNASSSATERANDDTSNLFAFLWNNLANAQAAVSGGRGASAAEDFAANKRLTLPDLRGCALKGFDDMGSTAAGQLGSAPVVTGGSTTSGSKIGSNVHTITEANLPSHTHSVSIISGSESVTHTHSFSATSGTESQSHTHTGTTSSDGSHNHSLNNAANIISSGGTVFNLNAAAAAGSAATITITDGAGAHTHTMTTGNASQTHTHSVSGTSGNASVAHTHNVQGDTGTGSGSGTAHNIISLSGLVTWFIKL